MTKSQFMNAIRSAAEDLEGANQTAEDKVRWIQDAIDLLVEAQRVQVARRTNEYRREEQGAT